MDAATIDVRELSAIDRCDICNAQAFIIALFKSDTEGKTNELLLCRHHGEANRDVLVKQALLVKAYDVPA